MADQFSMVVNHQCSKKGNEFVVSFYGAWGEVGEKLALSKKNALDTQDLVDIYLDENNKYVIKKNPRKVFCKLKNNIYLLKIDPELTPRYHPEGFCATRVGARLSIFLNGKLAANAKTDGCTEYGGITTEIRVSPRQRPKYTEVPANQFFMGSSIN